MARIVHITSVHTPYDTRILHRECASLANAGHEVTIVAAATHDDNVSGVTIRGVPPPADRKERMLHTGHQVVALAAQLDADLYHIHDPELLLCIGSLRKSGKPIVFDMHENLPYALLDKPWLYPPLRRPLAFLASFAEQLLLKNTHVIFAEDSYRKYYPWVHSWETVLNLPDVERISCYRRPRVERFTVGYIGGVGPARGSLTLLSALDILQRDGVELACECIGPIEAAHRRALEMKIAELRLRHVHLRGRMTQSEGLLLIGSCHAGVAILKNKPNYYESYPTKMFEYMALGLPVVVSNFPLYRSVVDSIGCGLCVDPDDPRGLADALHLLHDQPAAAATMGERGRRAVQERYNWSAEEHKLMRFYAQLGIGR